MFKKKDDKLDYVKVNEGVKLGVNILKIMFFLLIIIVFYVTTLLLSKWKILPFILDILKIISPLFIGILVAWLLDPVVTYLNRKGVNRVLGTAFTFIIMILFVAIFGKLLLSSIGGQVNELASSMPTIINYLKDFINSIFDFISDVSGYNLGDTENQIYTALNEFGMSITVKLPTLIVSFLSSIVTGGVNLIFGLIIGFYMLFDFGSIRKHFMGIIPSNKKAEISELLDRLNKNLKSYVTGTLTIMLILFLFQSLALTLAGMKAPLIFGLFCAITNVIPYFGPYIGGIPTVLVAFSIDPVTGIFTIIAVLIAQTLESYFLQPVVMGKTMNLHPVTIMLGLLIFAHFFGIIGMIVATPVIAVLKTIWTYYDSKYDILERITD